MDQPKIPTLKDSQKPQVKIRGLEAGVTLFERMKQFKKKDLAFILAGLGTLFMAPLAEHFLMAPDGGEAALAPGWGAGKGGAGSGIFGGGSSPYEGGSNGMAPGGPVGGGSDIITPLNVRDPSALVMGPGATQQPPAGSAAPQTAPPTAPGKTDNDWKDALAASARGATSAAKKALAPVPKIALTGSGLRGLGAASGGTSATASLGPISSAGLSTNKANAGGGLGNVRSAPGYKGVGTRGQTAGGGGLDALKAAAEKAGNEINRSGAASALDAAASQAIPLGGGAFGGNGSGGKDGADKGSGGNQDKSSKNVGESLEFLKQKQIQEKNIERWAKEQEAGDNKLELLKIRNTTAETFASEITKAVAGSVACWATPGKGFQKCMVEKDAKIFFCTAADGTRVTPSITGDIVTSPGKCEKGGGYLDTDKKIIFFCDDKLPTSNPAGTGCEMVDPKKDKDAGQVAQNAATHATGVVLDNTISDLCAKLQGTLTAKGDNGTKAQETSAESKAWITQMLAQGATIIEINDAIRQGGSPGQACGAAPESFKLEGTSLNVLQKAAGDAITSEGGVLALVKAKVASVDDADKAALTTKSQEMLKAVGNANDALSKITKAAKAIPQVNSAPGKDLIGQIGQKDGAQFVDKVKADMGNALASAQNEVTRVQNLQNSINNAANKAVRMTGGTTLDLGPGEAAAQYQGTMPAAIKLNAAEKKLLDEAKKNEQNAPAVDIQLADDKAADQSKKADAPVGTAESVKAAQIAAAKALGVEAPAIDPPAPTGDSKDAGNLAAAIAAAKKIPADKPAERAEAVKKAQTAYDAAHEALRTMRAAQSSWADGVKILDSKADAK